VRYLSLNSPRVLADARDAAVIAVEWRDQQLALQLTTESRYSKLVADLALAIELRGTLCVEQPRAGGRAT
jgi:hypothetical protein